MCVYLPPFHISWRQGVVQWNVIRYFLHEPLEALASMFLPGKETRTNKQQSIFITCEHITFNSEILFREFQETIKEIAGIFNYIYILPEAFKITDVSVG